jgi:hypothetical protein
MQRVAIVMALLAILSGTSANMGTAIVIAGTIHFFVCNPVIALLEAALLARWAKVPLQRAIALMIAANYLSFFVGLLLGGRISLTLGGISQMLWGKGVTFFLSLPYLLALLTLLLFALTVLIEAMPLYLAQQRDWRWSIGHSARVNLISYGLLVFLYLTHSDFGFLRNRFQPDLRFIQTVPTTVYYITPDGMLASIPITGGRTAYWMNRDYPTKDGERISMPHHPCNCTAIRNRTAGGLPQSGNDCFPLKSIPSIYHAISGSKVRTRQYTLLIGAMPLLNGVSHLTYPQSIKEINGATRQL